MTVHYVPAGVEAYSERTAQLYVKNKPNEKETTEFGPKVKRWRTKDRTVVEAMSSARGAVIPEEQFDVCVPIFSPTAIKACGLSLVLANPEVGKDYKKAPYEKQGIKSIVDSGGFQLLRANVDFVHPDGVIDRYNKDANIGMPLDLPVRTAFEPAYFRQVSHLIKANDDYILKRLDPGIDLALISHGSTVELRKARLDVLDRKANVVAIAGLGIKPPPGIDRTNAAVENLMYVISRYHKKTEYFHVLGVTSKLMMFFYALLERSGYVKNIGADSVSHRLGALVGMYDTADFKTLDLKKNQAYRQTPQCNCPICTSIDDLRIIHSWRILEAHNLWVRAEQTRFLCALAEDYLAGKVPLAEVHQKMDLNITLNKFTLLVNYIRDVMANKWKPMRSTSKTKGLAGLAQTTIKTDAHYEAVISRYEKFHGKTFPEGPGKKATGSSLKRKKS
ncbi:hypothetical protein [Burkholderia phage BCSR5]|nr:hypothetical protein [Burkholderia phage BCSR5]